MAGPSRVGSAGSPDHVMNAGHQRVRVSHRDEPYEPAPGRILTPKSQNVDGVGRPRRDRQQALVLALDGRIGRPRAETKDSK
jgi:hypothetical protein